MDNIEQILPPDEQAHLKLRALYESYGYSRYRMGKFEPYDIYLENKSFLKSEGIITFTDSSGHLMALKPDVTLSIVKNAAADGSRSKLYYNENVFRIERKGEEYREINQIGVEYIGAGIGYGEAEVVGIAAKSLSFISGDYFLSVSHMGYIGGLLNEIIIDENYRAQILDALTHKNIETLSAISKKLSLPQKIESALLGAAKIHGTFDTAIISAEQYCLNDEMSAAVEELKTLQKTLAAINNSSAGGGEFNNRGLETNKILLDFSVVNTLDYYNGIVFRGYIKGAPGAILSGGRYDGLLSRFGRPQGAVGFALYLSDLDRLFYQPNEYDADILLIYGDTAPEITAAKVEELISQGNSVIAEEVLRGDIRSRKTIRINNRGESE